MELLAFWNKCSIDTQVSGHIHAILHQGIYPESVFVYALWYALYGHGRITQMAMQKHLIKAIHRQQLVWSLHGLIKRSEDCSDIDLNEDLCVLRQLFKEFEANTLVMGKSSLQGKQKKAIYRLQDICGNLLVYAKWMGLAMDGICMAHHVALCARFFPELTEEHIEGTWQSAYRRFIRHHPKSQVIAMPISALPTLSPRDL